MNLPASFIDYTRALLGNEEYEKLSTCSKNLLSAFD